jgi:hypothetical protein
LRQLAGWTDSARGDADCRFDDTKDGAVRCIPPGGRRINETFADAACTTHALEIVPQCDGSLPTFAMLYPDGECIGTGAYEPYAVGAELTGALYSGGGDDVCMTRVLADGARIFAVTPIPPTEFPEVTQRVEMGAPGRLKPRYHTTSDGGCWFNDFWDSELMVSCWFTRTSQNEYRCLPGDYVPTISLYLDSACTQSVVGYDAGACSTGPVPPFVAGTSPTEMDECSDGIVPLETASIDAPVYRMMAGTCTLVPDSSGLYRVTPADPARFVAGTVMVE